MSKIEHLLFSKLHAEAAEAIDRGETPHEFITITVGLWGDSTINYTDLEHLEDDLLLYAKDVARLARASNKSAMDFVEAYGASQEDDGEGEGGEGEGGVEGIIVHPTSDDLCTAAREQACEALREAEVKAAVAAGIDTLAGNRPYFEPGNIVRLKSGGPTMTVRNVDHHGLHCCWFRDGMLCHSIFSSDAVRSAAGELL